MLFGSIPGVETETTGEKVAPSRSLGGDVVLMFGAKIATMVLTILVTVIVARALGPGGRGTVAVAITLVLILIQFGTLGVVSANPYFTAKDQSSVDRVVANSLWLAAGAGVLLIGVGVLIKLLAPALVEGLSWTALLVAVGSVPAGLLMLFLQSVFLGTGRTVAYNAVEVGQLLVTVLVLVVLLLVLDLGVLAVIATLSAGYVIGAAAYAVLLARERNFRLRPDTGLARTMLKYGARVYLATLMAFLVIRIDVFLVNGYLGADQVGLYSVAAALAEGMVMLPTVIGLNLFPRVARGAALETSASVFRIVSILFGALCLVSIPLAPAFISALYGDRFDGAVSLYYWLLPGIFSLGMLTILSQHFAGRGFPLQAMLVWFVGVGVNVAINVLFLERHGTYVASLASSVAYGILLMLHMRLFAKELGGYREMVPRPREAAGFVRLQLGRLVPALRQ